MVWPLELLLIIQCDGSCHLADVHPLWPSCKCNILLRSEGHISEIDDKPNCRVGYKSDPGSCCIPMAPPSVVHPSLPGQLMCLPTFKSQVALTDQTVHWPPSNDPRFNPWYFCRLAPASTSVRWNLYHMSVGTWVQLVPMCNVRL